MRRAEVLGQDAYGPSDKPQRGFEQGVLQGYVFSPRFRRPESDWGCLDTSLSAGTTLFDPETYLLRLPLERLRYLPEWHYWANMQRAKVWDNPLAYADAIPAMLSEQRALGFMTLVAGGPLLRSLYGYEAALLTAAAAASEAWQRTSKFSGDVLLGVAVTDASLGARPEADPDGVCEDIALWLDRTTGTDCAGYYIVVDWANDTYEMPQDPVTLSNLMYVIHALADTNARRVVVGYTGLWGILPVVAGAAAVATGWYLSGRRLSTSKFFRQGMARQPRARVWLRDILAEVTDDLLLPLCQGGAPSDGASDTFVAASTGEIPTCLRSRGDEVLHNWSVMGQLCSRLAARPAKDRAIAFLQMLDAAQAFFARHCRGTQQAAETVSHLANWREAVCRFRRMAGLD